MNEKISWRSEYSRGFAMVSAIAAMAMVSCRTYSTEEGNVFLDQDGRPRYGYRGTDSPNYGGGSSAAARTEKPATKKTPVIKRDPNNTTVDITPPESKKKPAADRTEESVSTGNQPVEEKSDSGSQGDAGESASGTASTPPDSGTSSSSTTPREDLPYGRPVVGKKGFVYSPYAPDRNYCDVQGVPPGTRVKCPYTGKPFRVP